MKLKDDTIHPRDLHPALLLAIMVAEREYERRGVELVLTSLNDGRHSLTSLHYAGCAADLRTRNLVSAQIDPDELQNAIATRLNKHYDVLVEPDHIHIEYQPRR